MKFRRILLTILMLVTFAGATTLAAGVSTGTVSAEAPIKYKVDINNLPNQGGNRANDTRVQAALNVTFGIIGGISLIMITIGGFRYISTQGDNNQIAEAKSTLIYAMIGLIISILAITIVTYVIGRLTASV